MTAASGKHALPTDTQEIIGIQAFSIAGCKNDLNKALYFKECCFCYVSLAMNSCECIYSSLV